MNVDELFQGARDAISVQRVYGEPIERDGVTIVPAASLRGGGGGGGDAEHNGGGGFGLAARPVGAWVIREGVVTWRPVVDLSRLLVIAAAGVVLARLLGR